MFLKNPFFKFDGRSEIHLERGSTVRLTNNVGFKRRCSNDVIWIDVENLSTILTPGANPANLFFSSALKHGRSFWRNRRQQSNLTCFGHLGRRNTKMCCITQVCKGKSSCQLQ
jgi:hypothetical protein